MGFFFSFTNLWINLYFNFQVYADLQPFVDNLGSPPGSQFDLVSLPVIFYLQNNPHMVDSIRNEIKDDVSAFNFKAVSIKNI